MLARTQPMTIFRYTTPWIAQSPGWSTNSWFMVLLFPFYFLVPVHATQGKHTPGLTGTHGAGTLCWGGDSTRAQGDTVPTLCRTPPAQGIPGRERSFLLPPTSAL